MLQFTLVHPVQHSPLRRREDAGRRYLQPLLRQLKRQPAPGVSGSLAHLLRVGLAQLQKLMFQSLVVGVDTGCALRLVEIDNCLLLNVGQPHGVTSPGPGWGERPRPGTSRLPLGIDADCPERRGGLGASLLMMPSIWL